MPTDEAILEEKDKNIMSFIYSLVEKSKSFALRTANTFDASIYSPTTTYTLGLDTGQFKNRIMLTDLKSTIINLSREGLVNFHIKNFADDLCKTISEASDIEIRRKLKQIVPEYNPYRESHLAREQHVLGVANLTSGAEDSLASS